MDELANALAAVLGAAQVTELTRLSGGASRDTFRFVADGRPLILQRQRAGDVRDMGVEVYLLTGDKIPPHVAVEIGLANRVVADDQLMTEAIAFAERLAAQPRQAIQETKRAINIHLQAAISMVAPFALSAEGESFGTDDLRATIDKFSKK